MKRTIRTIMYAAAVVLSAVSCQKFAEPSNPAVEARGTVDIRVAGLMGEYAQNVRSSLVNTVRVAWAAEDVVYVFDGTSYLGKLTAALDKKADGQTDEDRYASSPFPESVLQPCPVMSTIPSPVQVTHTSQPTRSTPKARPCSR